MNKQINDTMVMPDQTTSENSHQIKNKHIKMISPSNITLMKKRTVLFQNYGIHHIWYMIQWILVYVWKQFETQKLSKNNKYTGQSINFEHYFIAITLLLLNINY